MGNHFSQVAVQVIKLLNISNIIKNESHSTIETQKPERKVPVHEFGIKITMHF